MLPWVNFLFEYIILSKLGSGKLTYVNFRKKNNTTASDYVFHGKDISKEINVKRHKLQGGNYNIPHMKYKACDFCEDVFGYCSDIVLGDAWLPKYVKDPKGTNVIIVRNEYIFNLFKKFRLSGVFIWRVI